MSRTMSLARRIEINFAVSQGTYWMGFASIASYATAYLSYRGMDNTQIGLTSSLGSAMAIVLQLILSNVLDKHPEVRIKKLISVLFFIGLAAQAAIAFLPLPIACMILAYSLSNAMELSNNGYLNAQFVQFNNVGIPAKFGWPRGVGSLCYAIAAFTYGKLVEAYSPDVLMLCYLVGTGICVITVLVMPDPYAGKGVPVARQETQHTSYKEMLLGNPTLLVLLICILLNGIGNQAGYAFILRVVERMGCGTVEYGISEFIRAAAEVPALFASGFLLKHFKVKSMMAASFFFFGLRLLILAFAPSIGWVYFASTINMLCVGLNAFSSVMLVNSIVRENEKVRGQSLCILCGTVGSIVGSAYGGVMLDTVGLQAMMLTSFVFCLVACLGMVFFCKPDSTRQA